MGNVGCSASYCFSWIPTSWAHKVADYMHEMGHNLGMGHAGEIDGSPFSDMSDAMAACCPTRCYNAPHNMLLGWMMPTLELRDANFVEPVSVTLKSMSASKDGVIKIHTDWSDSPQNWWIAMKSSDSYDQFLAHSRRDNVQIKSWNGEKSTTHYATIESGENWTCSNGDWNVKLEQVMNH